MSLSSSTVKGSIRMNIDRVDRVDRVLSVSKCGRGGIFYITIDVCLMKSVRL